MSTAWLDRDRIAKAEGRFPLSVSMLSWGYNEEENIEEFLRRARSFMLSLGVEFEHILIDDCSTDRTFAIAEGCQEFYPELRIIRNEQNLNSGWNTRIAIQAATKDVLFWQTVDWAYDISKLGDYLWLLRESDVVQGVRIRSTKDRSDNFVKAVISMTNYWLIRSLFRLPLLDFQNVTLYPTKLAQAIDCETSTSFTNPELLIKAYWKGASFAQVPIGFCPRQKGEAKGTKWRSVLASVRQIWAYWARWILLNKRRDFGRGTIAPLSKDFDSSTPVARPLSSMGLVRDPS